MSTPRILLTGTRERPDPAPEAASLVERAADLGLVVAVVAVGADRDGQDHEALERCVRRTDRAVLRIDPRLSTQDEMHAAMARCGDGADLLIVVAPSRDVAGSALDLRSMSDAALAPAVLCDGLANAPIDKLIELARTATPLEVPAPVERPPTRARVGVAIDACFDQCAETDLDALEASGAELVPFSLMDDTISAGELEVDGLVIGDGHVERWSSELSRARRARDFVRSAAGSGLPIVATGGGFAYLTRGIRVASGALHPMAGVIDAESVVLPGCSQRGHVEVVTRCESIVGPQATTFRGFVQRDWLVRGMRVDSRRVYSTNHGPGGEGYASANVFATHFRVHWPTSARALGTFVDRCVAFAAAREYGARLVAGPGQRT